MEKVVNRSVLQDDVQAAGKRKSILKKGLQIKVGVIPLPLYVIFALVIYAAAVAGKLPNDMIGGFAVIMILGIVLSDLGMKLPILKSIGGPAILSLMVPSLLVFWNVLDPAVMDSVTTLMKTSNFLYLYISCLVAGSILGMNRRTLINGVIRIFIPMVVGTIAALAVGVAVGALLGYSVHHTIFYIVVPIIGGGIGEGILPLSIAYAQIVGGESGAFVAQMIPAAIIGNVAAIIGAGLLKKLGEQKPRFSGNGVLVKDGSGEDLAGSSHEGKAISFPLMGAGLLFACVLFTFGSLASKYIGIPGPIVMIISAALLKCFNAMPEKIEQGAFHLYKFVSSSLTWPLMVGLGMLYVPLNDVAAIISLPYVITCVSVVVAMILTGFYLGKWIKMYPVEAAIVTGCRGGLGGTGDVAILSAAGRMELMPFAQISTRIGGASTVILATLLLSVWH